MASVTIPGTRYSFRGRGALYVVNASYWRDPDTSTAGVEIESGHVESCSLLQEQCQARGFKLVSALGPGSAATAHEVKNFFV